MMALLFRIQLVTVDCSQRLPYVLLKLPIIGWRISEPMPKWIMLVTNGGDLIMS